MEETEIIRGKKTYGSVIALCILITLIGLIVAIAIRNCRAWGDGDAVAGMMEGIGVFIFFLVIDFLIYSYLCTSEIVVTNIRVYGKTVFGKRVDLPLDSISSIGTSAITARISIGTSSGRITFYNISNIDSINSELTKLINNRQNKSNEVKKKEFSNADELKKYKELLDSGAITEEEYNVKKKELLGL